MSAASTSEILLRCDDCGSSEYGINDNIASYNPAALAHYCFISIASESRNAVFMARTNAYSLAIMRWAV